MNILVASKNNAKIEGVMKAFAEYFDKFDISGISVASDVNDQPYNEETYIGASNRVNNLIKYANENNVKADYFVAIESGMIEFAGVNQIVSVAIIVDDKGFKSYGTSAGFMISNKYVEEVKKSGLNSITNKIFGENNERHLSLGTVGVLTNNAITRIDLNYQSTIMALCNFVHAEWR